MEKQSDLSSEQRQQYKHIILNGNTRISAIQALAAKEKGNSAYKAKHFEEALKFYDEAILLDPSDIIFLNNIAAVYFEQKYYDHCIATCRLAVDIGTQNGTDCKIIAKALARCGKAFRGKHDYVNSFKYLKKSVSMHMNADIAKLINKTREMAVQQEKRWSKY